MPHNSQQFLKTEVIKRIERLDLRARHIVEGFLSGPHRSRYSGQSIEFRQHREYAPGDDLRHVDWKVWAKQDRYYVKQYEADTNMRCTMLMDASGSMQYGSGSWNKYEYAATIVASLAYLVLRQQDVIGCVTFDDAVRVTVPQRSNRNHLESIVNALVLDQPREKTDIGRVLAEVAEGHPRRGMMILVSDLLADPAETLKGLQLLRQRGHDVLVFHVMDDDELIFPFTGPTRFEDLEQAAYLHCNPRALRAGYLEALQVFLHKIRVGCAAHTIDYALLRTSEPIDAALAKYLSNRLGMHGRN